ncbi:PAQR family membrane homeostasis protein TrhA [Roseicella frigidaeris]|uniref:Hemolysin III family protein n=1 Tax=Roseicella frigidaeris TaxID=2230885 RepID=A0A327MF66_9PROT|nr:hemolysin III family protein [Roseicella frigidaeris]RAI61125.1 hemolysin III family protein [Roseicella frigidaeris]
MAPPPAAPPAAFASRAEYAADAAVHVVGLLAGGLACLGLALTAADGGRPAAALGLYAGGLLAMLGCSALYNLARPGQWRRILQRLDHAAIFLMIAGTYTPVALLAIGGGWGWALFATVWTGALTGAALKLLAPARIERAAILLYLLLGWVGLLAMGPLLQSLPPRDLLLLLCGGALYSLGVRVHLATRLRFHTAIWHGLVLAAAACHYAVVLHIARNG